MTVDISSIAAAVDELNKRQTEIVRHFMTLIAESNDRMDKLMQEQTKLMQQIAKQKPAKPAPRPSEYEVLVNKSDGEQVSMSIKAPRRH